jgi:hypothetical protein
MNERVRVILVVLCNVLFPASTLCAVNETLKQLMSDSGTPRTSGTAALIRTVYVRAVDKKELLSDKAFDDESKEKRYLAGLQMRTGLDFSLTQDKLSRTFEKLCFTGDVRRRDFVPISSATADRIRAQPRSVDALDLNVYTYTPSKTVLRFSNQRPDGGVDKYANIRNEKIYFPAFHRLDRATRGTADTQQLELLSQAIDKGLTTATKSEVDGQVHLVLDIPGKFRLEHILDPTKNMAVVYEATLVDGKLEKETIRTHYTQLSDGQWYPLKCAFNKYVCLNGQQTLASSETYETLKDTVEFNTPIDPAVFSPPLENGTHIIDNRYDPPLEFMIDTPAAEVTHEEISKDEGAIALLFLPKIDLTQKLRKPFILDLAMRRLFLPFAPNDDIQDRMETLAKAACGDIAWDGTLLAMRGATVSLPADQSKNPWKCTERQWCTSCSPPEKTTLPCSIDVRTHEGREYVVTIQRIDADGVWLRYEEKATLPR